MKIGIDIDGVLAHFDKPFGELLSTLTGRPFAMDEPACWEWPEECGFTDYDRGRAWTYIKDHPTWWLGLYPYADSQVVFQPYEENGHEFYFMTARRTPLVHAMSMDWLEDHYQFEYTPTVLLSSDKGLLCKALGIDAFIDDRPSMCMDVRLHAPKTRVYLRSRLHNAPFLPTLLKAGVFVTPSLQTFFKDESDRLQQSDRRLTAASGNRP